MNKGDVEYIRQKGVITKTGLGFQTRSKEERTSS